MKTGKNTRFTKEWKIGLVSIAIIALFVWVCFFLAGRNIFSKENKFYAVFETAGGVNVSAPVVVNGKKVGRISEIEFVSASDHRIKIGLSVLKRYKINRGSVASVESLGLMNGSGVVITLGDSPEFLKSGDYIEGQYVPDLMAGLEPLMGTVGRILASLDSVMGNINSVLDRNSAGDLKASLAAFHASMANIERITAHADALVQTNEEKINSLVSNIEDLSQTLKDNQGEITAILTNFAAVSDTLARSGISTAMHSLGAALQQTESILSRVNTGEGSVGQLLTNDTLYRNLEKSSRQLNLLLQDLRVNPERYVHISVFGRKEKKSAKPALE